MTILVPSLQQIINAPMLQTGITELQTGKLFYKTPVKLHLLKNLKTAGIISTNGMIRKLNGVSNSALDVALSMHQPENTDTYFNIYGEIITSDLSNVSPFVSGIFKDIVSNWVSIQQGALCEDNFIIVQFPNHTLLNITKFNLCGMFIGALPTFKISTFLKVYPASSFSWESIQYLMEIGLNTELKSFVETIGSLDVRFNSSHILNMRAITNGINE